MGISWAKCVWVCVAAGEPLDRGHFRSWEPADVGRRGPTGGSDGGSSRDLHAGGSGGLRRQVSGFEPEAQQQLGGDEAHTREQRPARFFLTHVSRPRWRHFGAVKRLRQPGVLVGRTPRGCHRKQMDPANGKHTSPRTKTPEFQGKLRDKDAESTPPLPRRYGRLPVSPAPVEGGRFTFVTVSAAVRVEVISVPQPAHLRHLGNWLQCLTSRPRFSFFCRRWSSRNTLPRRG